jgi:hypothetical protein
MVNLVGAGLKFETGVTNVQVSCILSLISSRTVSGDRNPRSPKTDIFRRTLEFISSGRLTANVSQSTAKKLGNEPQFVSPAQQVYSDTTLQLVVRLL